MHARVASLGVNREKPIHPRHQLRGNPVVRIQFHSIE
jgi:hypothetical protein